MNNKKIYAFDLGKSSIGICARKGHEILTLKSLIINADYADISTIRDRKRIIKTKEAHKKRENFFTNNIWVKAGLTPLSKDDNKFKKEFPSKKENIIYSSTLLRIALLQNKPLEEWQIYKALFNAIQRRGYDDKLPWLSESKSKRAEKTKDEEENKENVNSYKQLLKEHIPDEKYHYPCYLDATLLGLWDYNNPEQLNLWVNHNAQPARDKNRVAPRELVIKELNELFNNAKKQLPSLENIDTNYFLYGEGLEAYASYNNPKYKKYLGKEWDAQGVIGQKIPRFENRILSKCQLLPKRNVCKANTIENIKFVLLMGLKNFRYYTSDGFKHSLTSQQIKTAYELRELQLLTWVEEGKKCNINKQSIEKAIGQKITKDNEVKIEANTSGRSRFCKPVLIILSEIILSGKSPLEFDLSPYVQNQDETNPQKGITKSELEQAISRLGDSWDNFHIGDNREIKESLSKEQQVAKIIGSTTNPVVRHRMQWFYNELKQLSVNYGTPDEVIIEFIRGDKNDALAQRYILNQNQNEQENNKIKKKLEESGLPFKGNFEKLKLLEKQGGKCIYTGVTLGINDLPNCEIDHIVPISQNGCDALYNKVLCTKDANQQKSGQTPHKWLHDTPEWTIFVQRVGGLRKSLGDKKADILTSENPNELIEHYNGLAETAQIARMAQQITAIHFGWGLQTKDEKRRVFVSNGTQTAEFRKKYRLNSLLGDNEKKNRDNNKHHALDAIAISYSREVNKMQKENGEWTRGVQGFQRAYIEEKFNELMPKKLKPDTSRQKIKETIYGKRVRDGIINLVTRKELTRIEKKENSINKILDDDIRIDLLEQSKQITTNEDWNNLLEYYIHPKKQSKVKKIRVIETKTSEIEYDGNGRERIGSFCDFGNKGTKGQFKASDAHKGQYIYFDEKGVPRVMPVCTNQKKAEVQQILKNKGYKLYKDGMFFYSSVQLYIPKEFKAGSKSYPSGNYELNTIEKVGTTKIKDANGNIISTSIKYLTEADFELFNESKHLPKTT